MSATDSSRRDAYQFGDSDLAAERLRILAQVFEPSTREFLARLTALAPRDVLDLGCGPGDTTRLLAEIFPTARVLGIDNSANFISLARLTPSPRLAFEVADVTQTVPGGPYDIIYCRYLLTHLSRAQAAVELWGRHLRPGGIVAIEENDWIHTEQPAFAKYLAIVEATLAFQGQKLYIGAELDRMDFGHTLLKQSSEVVPIVVDDRAAANMFLPNLATWRGRPFVSENYSPDELDALRRDLERLARDESPGRSISFSRRRLVLARIH